MPYRRRITWPNQQSWASTYRASAWTKRRYRLPARECSRGLWQVLSIGTVPDSEKQPSRPIIVESHSQLFVPHTQMSIPHTQISILHTQIFIYLIPRYPYLIPRCLYRRVSIHLNELQLKQPLNLLCSYNLTRRTWWCYFPYVSQLPVCPALKLPLFPP